MERKAQTKHESLLVF